MLNISSASRVLCYLLFALPGGGGGGGGVTCIRRL